MSWPLVELSEVAPAKAFKPTVLSDKNSVLQLTLDHIESNSGQLLKHHRAPASDAGNSTHWFSNKHVLYSKLRPYLNKVYLPDETGIGTTELVPMLPDEERLDRKYLAYYLRSKSFVDWISSQTAGAKMPRVSMTTFWEHKIPLPPLAEQKRIAAILEKADAIRRKRQQAIQLADDFLRATFLDMFGDPVTNPKGWETKRIKDVTSEWRGGAPFKPEDFESEGVPVLHKGAIQKNGIVLVDPNKKAFTSIEFSEKYKKSEVTSNFTAVTLRDLVPTGPSIGLISNLKYANRGRYILAQGAYGFLVKSEQVNSDYLVYLSNNVAFRRQLIKYWVGSTQIHIRTPIFQNMEIPIPSIELQNTFAEVVDKIYKSINKYQSARNELNDLFRSLSQKAFSGEL